MKANKTKKRQNKIRKIAKRLLTDYYGKTILEFEYEDLYSLIKYCLMDLKRVELEYLLKELKNIGL